MAAIRGEREEVWLRQRRPMAVAAMLLAGAAMLFLATAWDVLWAVSLALALALAAVGLASIAFVRRDPPLRLPGDGAETRRALEALRRNILDIEGRLGEVEHSGGAGIRNSVSELTAEIGLLGGLVKDLAETVAIHDASLGRRQNAHVAKLPDTPGSERSSPVFASETPALLPTVPAQPSGAGQALYAQPPVGAAPSRPARGRNGAPAPLPPLDPSDENGSLDLAARIGARRAGRGDGTGGAPDFRDRDARAAARDGAIVAAIERDSLELFLQPIMSLPQRKPKLYEALGRVRLDAFEQLAPADFLPLVERRGLSAALDERIVARTLKVARHLQRSGDTSIACNISPASLSQPGFLRVLLRLAEADVATIGRLVVELPQRFFQGLDAERAGVLAALVDKGVRLSMDSVVDLKVDPAMLSGRGVRFVKIPASLLLGNGEASAAHFHPADISAMLARADIALVAEMVESESVVAELLDLAVPLAQGFLFAKPRPVRSEIYAATESAAVAPGSPASGTPDPTPESAAPAGPRPFRAYLRRAGA